MNKTSYSEVKTFNLDEYVGLSQQSPDSYHSYMKENLFNHINIPKDQTYIPNGLVADLALECLHYEQVIREAGGIDLQILGVGENGHIGFNEPGTRFDSTTHVVQLTESTKHANAKYFHSIETIPTKAITMGISTIMKAKQIILLASGPKKARAIFDLRFGEVTNQVPATILKNHPNVTIILDEEAYSLCMEFERGQIHAR